MERENERGATRGLEIENFLFVLGIQVVCSPPSLPTPSHELKANSVLVNEMESQRKIVEEIKL